MQRSVDAYEQKLGEPAHEQPDTESGRDGGNHFKKRIAEFEILKGKGKPV